MRDPNFDIKKLINHIHGKKISLQQGLYRLYPSMNWINDVKGVEAEELDDKIFQCECCGIWRYVDNRNTDEICCTICKP